MGYVFYELVPAAILLENPGITKEEFVELLSQTEISGDEYNKKDLWSPKVKKDYHKVYSGGLGGLATGILHLSVTKQFIQAKNKRWEKDEFDLDVGGVRYCAPPLEFEGGRPGEWEVDILVGHTLERYAHFGRFHSHDEQLSKGQIIDSHRIGNNQSHHSLIESIVSLKEKSKIYTDWKGEKHPYKDQTYVLRIRNIQEITHNQRYASLTELLKYYPEYDPKTMYNWNQRVGALGNVSGATHTRPPTSEMRPHFPNETLESDFCWQQQGGKYSLHPKVWNWMSAGWSTDHNEGYTDLILTAEAIKKKAWKLLSYRGRKHLTTFLKKYPDSRERYEQAIWDSHTSLAAKHKGMTTSEFLRWRLLKF